MKLFIYYLKSFGIGAVVAIPPLLLYPIAIIKLNDQLQYWEQVLMLSETMFTILLLLSVPLSFAMKKNESSKVDK